MNRYLLVAAVFTIYSWNNLLCQVERDLNLQVASGNNAKVYLSKYVIKRDTITYFFNIKTSQAPNSVEIPRITVEPNITYGKGMTFYIKPYSESQFEISIPDHVRYIFFENIDFTNRWQGGLQKVVKESKLLLFNQFPIPDYLDQIKEQDIIRIQITNIDTVKPLCTSTSDVNENIPTSGKTNPSKFALIIGNENYKQFEKTTRISSNVPYAQCDAMVFRDYAQKTLGIDESNIIFILNATAGMINENLDILSRIAKKAGSEAEILFYYAGHGLPDEESKRPYLLPVDANPRNLLSAIQLKDIIQKLKESGAGKIILFLDACFSGGGREADVLQARSVKIKPGEESFTGNILVISACSEDETAMAYDLKNHGLFTYFLMLKIKEARGEMNYGELVDYLQRTVSIESLKINQKEQNPHVSFDLQKPDAWRSWKL